MFKQKISILCWVCAILKPVISAITTQPALPFTPSTLPCNDGSAHWFQPTKVQQDYNNGSLITAWCYPTAAASLLAKLAYEGKWTSRMSTRYPDTTTFGTSANFETKPWKDYVWHSNYTLNLGYYTKTNHAGPNTGTSLVNGRQGIEDFVKATNPSVNVVAEIHEGYPSSQEQYPLLLHIKSACLLPPINIGLWPGFESPIKLEQNQNDIAENIPWLNHNPSSLDHTVVCYGTNEPAEGSNLAIEYNISMNLPTAANLFGNSCENTTLQLPIGMEACITHYTTVVITPNPSSTSTVPSISVTKNSDSDLSAGAIAGIASGAVVAAVLIAYFVKTRKASVSKVKSALLL